jgi:hypothetical protein
MVILAFYCRTTYYSIRYQSSQQMSCESRVLSYQVLVLVPQYVIRITYLVLEVRIYSKYWSASEYEGLRPVLRGTKYFQYFEVRNISSTSRYEIFPVLRGTKYFQYFEVLRCVVHLKTEESSRIERVVFY